MSINVGAKRLTEEDVKAIFSSVANNQQPPPRLKFKIIIVPPNGLKLSPPSFEFDDGLYVLIRSPKKRLASIPSELADELLTDSDLASLPSCPWSLSGPQYPKNLCQKTQQRYCYPKGNPSYSNGKGGAMWTMLDSNGQEDIDCRIMHVYHSNKRASVIKATSQETKPKNVATRHSKRKSGVGVKPKKKNKIAATVEPFHQFQSLFHGDPLCPSQMSFDLDNDLAAPATDECFDSNNLFDTKESPTADQNFSFMPVETKNIDVDAMIANNPAFNSAASRPTSGNHQHHSNGYYYGPPYPYHPHAWAGGYGYYGDWTRPVPSIPQLTSSEYKDDEKQKGKEKTSSVKDFSKRLSEIETSIKEEVLNSKIADRVIKLHLLQDWAKQIAQAPLLPQKAPTLDTAEAESESQTVQTKSQTKIKVESPGTPSITP